MDKINEALKHRKRQIIFLLTLTVVFGLFFDTIFDTMIIYLFFLIPIIDVLSNFFKDKKYVLNLSDDIKETLNKELENTLLTNEEWYLTDNYIFVIQPSIRVVKYEDIVLMYFKLHLSPGKFNSKIYQQVVIVLNDGQKYKFTVEVNNNDDFIKCATIINEKNKNILIETTKEK